MSEPLYLTDGIAGTGGRIRERLEDFVVEELPLYEASGVGEHLYLTVQIMEMSAPLVLVLNMMDEAESRGLRIDIASMSKEMGIPVIPMVANRNQGTEQLLQSIINTVDQKSASDSVKIEYRREVENEIARLEKELADMPLSVGYSPRWLAIKLIEGDEAIMKKFEEACHAA